MTLAYQPLACLHHFSIGYVIAIKKYIYRKTFKVYCARGGQFLSKSSQNSLVYKKTRYMQFLVPVDPLKTEVTLSAGVLQRWLPSGETCLEEL